MQQREHDRVELCECGVGTGVSVHRQDLVGGCPDQSGACLWGPREQLQCPGIGNRVGGDVDILHCEWNSVLVLELVQLHGEAGGWAGCYSLQLHGHRSTDCLLAECGMHWGVEQRVDVLHRRCEYDVPNMLIGIKEGTSWSPWSPWVDPASALLLVVLLVAFVLHPTKEDRRCGSLRDDRCGSTTAPHRSQHGTSGNRSCGTNLRRCMPPTH